MLSCLFLSKTEYINRWVWKLNICRTNLKLNCYNLIEFGMSLRSIFFLINLD